MKESSLIQFDNFTAVFGNRLDGVQRKKQNFSLRLLAIYSCRQRIQNTEKQKRQRDCRRRAYRVGRRTARALDVPSAINGTEVAYLGFEKYDIAINYYTLTSRNLLRLYIPENILSIKPYVFESLSAPDAKIIYNGAAEPSVHFSSSPEIYVYRGALRKNQKQTRRLFRRRRLYRLPVMSMDFGNIRTCQRSVFEQLLRSSQQRIFQG